MTGRLVMAWLAVALLAACGGDGDDESPTRTASPAPTSVATEPPDGSTLTLESDGFDEGGTIPDRYTCEGDNVSPELSWTAGPEGSHSLVLIMDDPDAPGGTFTHWLLYDLPPETRSLPEDVETGERPAAGGVQGRNEGNRVGYTGPCPPEGQTHTYVFTLYVLDAPTGLEPGVSDDEVHAAIEGHVLAEGRLTGEFGR